MPAEGLRDQLIVRGHASDVTISAAASSSLAVYLELLEHWNRRINLTSLPLDPPSDAAIDRLIIEPVAAARRLMPGDRLVVDLGSGGGSPALPLKIAARQIALVMVESRARKAAFLREAVRRLELSDTQVETARFEDVATQPALAGRADVVTVRAVRADAGLRTAAESLLRPGGRLFWFGDLPSDSPLLEGALQVADRQMLVAGQAQGLVVLRAG